MPISRGVDEVEVGEAGFANGGFVDEEFGCAGEDSGFVAIAVGAGELGKEGHLGCGRRAEESEDGTASVAIGTHGGEDFIVGWRSPLSLVCGRHHQGCVRLTD